MSAAADIAGSLAIIMARAQAEEPPAVNEDSPDMASFEIRTPVGRFYVSVMDVST